MVTREAQPFGERNEANALVCVNARADECYAPDEDRGRRIVRYRGELFVIIGLYFECVGKGESKLCYVLRSPPNDQRDLAYRW